MKNQKIKYTFFSLLAFLLFAINACTDLEPELYSDLTTKNAYGTESDIDAAMTGVYSRLNRSGYLYYAGYLVLATDYASDMGFSTATGDPTKMGNFTYDANNRYFRVNWLTMYEVIGNANILLSKIDDVDMDESKKNEIKAQARFLRALAYRDLTDGWGAVPLITEALDPTETLNYKLSSVEEINAQIIEDCKFAIANLPEEWSSETGVTRATKGAALMLLGKVYMRSHDYANAKIYIDQVLELRDKGIYQLNPDFKNEWSESNKMDKGLIFGIMHEVAQNGALIAKHFGPTDHPEAQSNWQYYAVSLPFWRKYSDLDPRKEFFYYNYEGAAPRDDTTKNGFYYKMPEIGENTAPNDTTKLLANVATKKYTYELISNTYEDGRTIQVFRIADAILCKAEIENALNGPGAALPYINEIRSRAGAPVLGSSAEFPAPASEDEMISALVDERGFELVFEYQRRADLIRLGKFEEVCNAYLREIGSTKVVTENLRYFPYPLQEARIHNEMNAENANRLP